MVSIKGGDKLQSALNELLKNATNAASVDVGFMGNATEPDGTSTALVAALNNYGGDVVRYGPVNPVTKKRLRMTVGKRPPRPFFDLAVQKNKRNWPINLGTALKKTKMNAATSLGLLGLEVKEEVQDEIRELTSPPLTPATIKRKGFEKPLIDSSTMLKSVTLKVNTK